MGKISTLSNAKNVREGAGLLRNRRAMWCMLRETWKGNYRMSLFTTLVTILGLVYIFTPFDFDWIPFIGWIDDALVAFYIIKRLQKETQRFNRHKAMERRMEC